MDVTLGEVKAAVSRLVRGGARFEFTNTISNLIPLTKPSKAWNLPDFRINSKGSYLYTRCRTSERLCQQHVGQVFDQWPQGFSRDIERTPWLASRQPLLNLLDRWIDLSFPVRFYGLNLWKSLPS